jgi:hypothetical protein
MKEDPALYAAAKAQAIESGILGPGRVNDGRITKAPVTTQQEPSAAQQAAMVEFDRETCAAYFSANPNKPGARNAGQLAATDNPAYQRLKLAAQGHGVLPDSPTVVVRDHSHRAQLAERDAKQVAPVVQNDGEHRFRLADSLCDEAGVARGTMVSMREFSKVSQTIAVNKAAAAKAAKAATQPTDAPAVAATEPEATASEAAATVVEAAGVSNA